MDFTNLPMGFVMGIAGNGDALDAYNRLTEAEKERIIFECKDARKKSDMEKIIDRLSGRWI